MEGFSVLKYTRLTWFTRPRRRASGGILAYLRKAAACPRHQLSPWSTGRLTLERELTITDVTCRAKSIDNKIVLYLW